MKLRYPPISAKLPVYMHGADYNPDQWLHDPQVLEEDIRLMKLAGCNVMAVGIFAWAALEPEEGRFEFGWLDDTLDRLHANGIYAWLATPSGARPAWMSQQYPEVLRVEANRVRNLHGGRHNHCWTSPVYREKVTIINAKLAQRYANHPALVGWHVSNEYGGDCHCPYCQEAFREWLKEKYGSLDELNRAWWTSFWAHTYTDWSQIESPARHGENMVHGHNVDWRRFITDRTIDFFLHEIEPLRAASPEVPVTTNFHMIEGVDYRKFAQVLDVVSWDAYPTWHDAGAAGDGHVASWSAMHHDLFRSLKGGQPFMLMESTPSLTNWQPVSKLKRPGMHRLSSLQAVAHGSDTVQYFQWRKGRGSSEKFHGAVVDHVGHEHTRVFRDVAELGGTLAGLTEVIGCTVPAEAAIVFDWDNRWAVKDAQGPRNMGLKYEGTVHQHYRALWELGVPMDIVGSEDPFDRYKLLIAPMMYMVKPGVGERIERFVENGGTFVATYWSGIVDENDLCFLGGFPGPLGRTLGIWAEEIEGLHDHDRNALRVVDAGAAALGLPAGREYEVRELCELVHAEEAEVLAVYADDFYAGRPALTVRRLGAGCAYYLAARAQEPFCGDFYGRLVADLGVRRALAAELPAGVTASVRTDGEHDYVFVQNFCGAEAIVTLDGSDYTDVESGLPEASGSRLKLDVNGVRVLKRSAIR
ncbi:beta-galactosidase [Paenibacillus tarimensis]